MEHLNCDSARHNLADLLALWWKADHIYCTILQKWRLPLNSLWTLEALLSSSGPDEPARLADHLNIPRQTMTIILDSLERRGVIRREAHPTDRRRKRIRLTETGRAFANEVSTDVNAIEVEAMSRLPAAEQRAFVDLSRKFYDALKTAGEQFRQKEAAAAK